MWKDFFSFTKRERITLVVLTTLVVLIQGLLWTSNTWVPWLPEAWQGRYRQEEKLRAMVDSISDAKRKGLKPVYPGRETSSFGSASSRSVVLKPFNPNTADSSTLLALGIRSYVVKNMLKYRSKGGRFRKSADVSRIYGMTPETFAAIEPYIRLEDVFSKSEDKAASESEGLSGLSARGGSAQGGAYQVHSVQERGSTGQQTRVVEPSERSDDISQPQATRVQSTPLAGLTSHSPMASAFDLNRADTALLLQIKGVGKVTAERIVKYRKQLGGFYSLQQLDEVDGLYPETKARLKSVMQLTPTDIRPLRVNEASLEKLREHPYVSFWQAKAMVELRKARGRIRSIEELAAYKEFKPADLERLKWYLAF